MAAPEEGVRTEFYDSGELKLEVIPPGGPGNTTSEMYLSREYRRNGVLLKESRFGPGGRGTSRSYYASGALHTVEEHEYYGLRKRVVYGEDGNVLSSYEHVSRTAWILAACEVALALAVGWYVFGVVKRWRKKRMERAA
jgi:hypothetical protein